MKSENQRLTIGTISETGNFKSKENKQFRKLLLIIEDDLDLMNQLYWAFRGEFEIFRATSKDEAVRLLENIKPQNVILDLHLPPNTGTPAEGLYILRHLKKVSPETKVIVVSANQSMQVMQDVIREGAYAFLGKPFTITELKEKIQK